MDLDRIAQVTYLSPFIFLFDIYIPNMTSPEATCNINKSWIMSELEAILSVLREGVAQVGIDEVQWRRVHYITRATSLVVPQLCPFQ